MKKNTLQIFWSIIIIFALSSCSTQSKNQLHEKSLQMKISDNWELFPNSDCPQSGHEVSSSSFNIESAINTQVPTTVLNAQVQSGIYKDIYFGDNTLEGYVHSMKVKVIGQVSNDTYLKIKSNPKSLWRIAKTEFIDILGEEILRME